MNDQEDIGGVVECRIAGARVTTEMLWNYLRSWARHGVYFSPHRAVMEGVHVVHHELLTYRFSHCSPDRLKRGQVNVHFLDPVILAGVIPPALPAWTRTLVFPVAYIGRNEEVRFETFLCRLRMLLSVLHPAYRCAIGVQNAEYLLPDYFSCLRKHAMAHTFITSPTMPGLLDQVRLPHAFTAEMSVVLTEPSSDPEWLMGMVELVRQCVNTGRALYVVLAGASPHQLMLSLSLLMEFMSEDLAVLSPLRRRAA